VLKFICAWPLGQRDEAGATERSAVQDYAYETTAGTTLRMLQGSLVDPAGRL